MTAYLTVNLHCGMQMYKSGHSCLSLQLWACENRNTVVHCYISRNMDFLMQTILLSLWFDLEEIVLSAAAKSRNILK